MAMVEKARFDTRISKEQKELFEYAAQLGGFRNLTDFVVQVLLEKSRLIIAEHQSILVSKRDQEVFFSTITSEISPNEALQSAAARYQKLLGE
jgi:uncharacterized protein (DUF1778 family)